MKNGAPVAVKADDDKNAVVGDLEYSGEIKGIQVKTAFTILDVPNIVSKFRRPTITPLTEVVTVYGEKTHCSFESVAMVGKIKAVEGMAPGSIAVSWSFGHWGYGASDASVNGKTIKGDKRRTSGLCPNAAMKIDPVLKNSCMTDPIGGSASFYETRVNLVKA
ncbi:MAG: hypothetical protein K0B01_03640 [Syntrophobacterales bacterium]|nr:hypothetical protein [Syntrophobacterales bacterium]